MALLDWATKKLRYNQLQKTIASISQDQNIKTCLNVGGNYGYADKILTGLGYEVSTCDIEAEHCAYCNLEEGLPYEDSAFDLIVCLAVVEHVANWPKALSELKRVSKKAVIVTTPSIYGKPVLEALALLGLVNKQHIDDHKYYLTHSDFKAHGYSHEYFTFWLNQCAVYQK